MKTKRKRTTSTTLPGGTFKLADDLILTRVGYGAMQLAGPHVFGPPADHDGALAVQVAKPQSIAPVVCVQNFYNIARREDDSLIDSLAEQGITYVPYFPLRGFSPLRSAALSSVAARLHSTPMAVSLAWLLQRSP